VDSFLDALASRDPLALEAYVDFAQVPCETLPQEFSATPECRPGEPPGTFVELIPVVVCHGGHNRRGELSRDFFYAGSGMPLSLYAATETGSAETPLTVVLATPEGNAVALGFSDRGLTAIQRLCAGPVNPEALVSGSPRFLLPPP
jgi:hypothetical protein